MQSLPTTLRWNLLVALLCLALPVAAEDLSLAEGLFRRTDYAGALRVALRQEHPGAPGYAIAGRSSLMEGKFKAAVEYFQKAVALEPRSSEYALWLGRAWGRKAEAASPLTAPMAASHAREWLEKAVALDPKNGDALDDLFEYYLEAPVFLGGGLDKAEALAHRIETLDPAEGRFDLARLALKRGQTATAEQHFRTSVALKPKAIAHVIAFARFLAHQGRINESTTLLDRGDAAAPGSPRLLYARAAIQIETHQDLGQARRLLERYLASDLTPDDPSRESAQKLLRQAQGT
ncbi:MAG TPA: tetratricopeptide repeat protein [Bryobacteraceae bacterium]|nr:tetratricopeptide repeat protein [Bryobacteraceae bacterium]